MSIRNFIDGSIPFGDIEDMTQLSISLTGAFTTNFKITFSRSGNMVLLSIPSPNGLETGIGGKASGTFIYPNGFIPITLPGNPVMPTTGIYNLSINNDITNRNGFITLSNSGQPIQGTINVGIFDATGTTVNNIGLNNNVSLLYVCQ